MNLFIGAIIPCIFLTVICIGGLFLFIQSSKAQTKRSQHFRHLAWSMGLQYRGESEIPQSLQAILPEFATGRANHVIVGQRQQRHFYCFEARTPYGTRGPVQKTAIFALDLTKSNIDLPHFVLRPRQTADPLKQKLGFHRISLPHPYDTYFTLLNFDSKPLWDKQLAKIPAGFYEQLHPNTYLLSNGRWLLYLKAKHSVTPTEKSLNLFIKQGLEICLTLKQTLSM